MAYSKVDNNTLDCVLSFAKSLTPAYMNIANACMIQVMRNIVADLVVQNEDSKDRSDKKLVIRAIKILGYFDTKTAKMKLIRHPALNKDYSVNAEAAKQSKLSDKIKADHEKDRNYD